MRVFPQTIIHQMSKALSIPRLASCVTNFVGPALNLVSKQSMTTTAFPILMGGGQEFGHRYQICKPCHCHATYPLFVELKFHSNQLYNFLATGCAAVTRLEF